MFDEHQAASYHRLAMNYEVIVPQCGDVKEMQNEATATCQNENFMLWRCKAAFAKPPQWRFCFDSQHYQYH